MLLCQTTHLHSPIKRNLCTYVGETIPVVRMLVISIRLFMRSNFMFIELYNIQLHYDEMIPRIHYRSKYLVPSSIGIIIKINARLDIYLLFIYTYLFTYLNF